jgi:hypothetical protein
VFKGRETTLYLYINRYRVENFEMYQTVCKCIKVYRNIQPY